MEISARIGSRKTLLTILGSAAFMVLLQAYLVAPLVPVLTHDFQSTDAITGLAVPAYTIPYGLSTLFYGPLSDRLGRKPVLLTLLGLMALSMFLIALSPTIEIFLLLRVVTGITTGGIVPISIALFGDIYPFAERGKPLGVLYGAMAGGMTFGSTLGAYLNPLIGWRSEFVTTGGLCLILFLWAASEHRNFPAKSHAGTTLKEVFSNAKALMQRRQSRSLYAYVFLNGVFHSGVFAWLGYFFKLKFNLDDQGIGLALLGYGVPGMLLGISIGNAADKYGRQRLIPIGLALGALSVCLLAFKLPLLAAAAAVTVLSLGYDMTQPLFAGMVTSLVDHSKRGQAVGLSACMLFLGYGTGALVFHWFMTWGLDMALIVFAIFEALLFLFALRLFKFSWS